MKIQVFYHKFYIYLSYVDTCKRVMALNMKNLGKTANLLQLQSECRPSLSYICQLGQSLSFIRNDNNSSVSEYETITRATQYGNIVESVGLAPHAITKKQNTCQQN